jgi:hypothetical protein
MTVHAMIRPAVFDGYRVPEHTQDALRNYVEHGLEPGSFLTAVLTNDLFGALGRADYMNKVYLEEICRWIYNEIPADAWGSREAVDLWIERIRLLKSGEYATNTPTTRIDVKDTAI